MDLALDGVNQIVNTDTTAKNALYDTLRETGKLLNATSGGGDFATVTKRLLMNIEDYYTHGRCERDDELLQRELVALHQLRAAEHDTGSCSRTS